MNKKYSKEYEIHIDEKGKQTPVYIGPVYRITMPENALKRAKIKLILNAAAMAVLFVAMGLTENGCTRQIYAGLPYALLAVPSVYAVTDAVKFWFVRVDMERVQYEGSFLHLMAWAIASMVLSVAACIGGLVFIFGSQDAMRGDYVFVPLAVLSAVAAYVFSRQSRCINNHVLEAKS